MVGIIDYKTGNLRSVENALYRAGVEYTVTAEPAILRSCSDILLPGVGDAGWAMGRIRENGIADIIATFTQPVMGIWLGMQIMCSYSEESDTRCLGIFPGKLPSEIYYLRQSRPDDLPTVCTFLLILPFNILACCPGFFLA